MEPCEFIFTYFRSLARSRGSTGLSHVLRQPDRKRKAVRWAKMERQRWGRMGEKKGSRLARRRGTVCSDARQREEPATSHSQTVKLCTKREAWVAGRLVRSSAYACTARPVFCHPSHTAAVVPLKTRACNFAEANFTEAWHRRTLEFHITGTANSCIRLGPSRLPKQAESAAPVTKSLGYRVSMRAAIRSSDYANVKWRKSADRLRRIHKWTKNSDRASVIIRRRKKI